LKLDAAAGKDIIFDAGALMECSYRPFTRQTVYFNRDLNNRVYQLPSMFPTQRHQNIGFYILGLGASKDFSALMTNTLPDLNFYGSEGGQFFPRWTYEKVDTDDGGL